MSFDYTALFLVCATVFFLLGWLDLLPVGNRKKWARKWLRDNGKPVVATIDDIQQNPAKHGRPEHWVIITNWEDPENGRHHQFKSDGLDFDPTIQLSSGLIAVLIDPQNPRRYYIDTSELLTTTANG